MTVQAIEANITYTFNDEGQYPFAFDILKPKDVTVQFIDNQGIRHVLAIGTDYLVVDNAGSRYIEIISTCGFIGQPGQLFIFRDMPVEQPTDWVNNEELDMELLEKSFDRIIMILQQFNTQMTTELAAITWRAGWKTGTVYKARDLVQAPNSNIYLAIRGHTAGVFETDLLTGYWHLVLDIAEITGYAEVADRLVLRDENGTAKFGAPTDPEHPMRLGDISLRENIKVTVGTGGDFPTINAAVLHLSRFTPDLGVTAEVELMSGFVMREQLFVEGLDLGWIMITGIDAETVINEPSLTRALVNAHKPAFGVANGTLPTIGQLFSFSSKGSADDLRHGVMACSVGRATILPGCGVKNAGSYGCAAFFNSTINAQGSNVSGAGVHGIYAVHSSAINATNADASSAEARGICAAHGSTINAPQADASGAGVQGIYAGGGSTINADSADASGAGANGIEAIQGSTINAPQTDARGAGDLGFAATQGSTINAQGANASGAGTYGIYVQWGSTINAQGATGTLSQAKNTVTGEGIIFQP